jgi:hypothetical protein
MRVIKREGYTMDVLTTATAVAAAPATEHAWNFLTLVALTAIGGAIGGFAELLLRLELVDGEIHCAKHKLSSKVFKTLAWAQIPIGICGAAAVAFIFSSTTWFPPTDTPIHCLWLLSLSVVAGYGAKRFMAMVSRKLEKDIAALNEEVDQNRERVEQVAKLSESRDMVARAMALLGPPVKATQVELHSSQLELGDWLKKNPCDRTPSIVAGRLFRVANDLGGAIAILSNFLTAKKRANQTDSDYADVLYQRACYRCVWAQSKGGAAAEELKRSGLEDLRQSVALNPENADAAAQDEDFQPWSGDDDFKAIVTPMPTVTNASRS